MLLEIIAPDREWYSGEVDLIQVPGSKGSFQILRRHAPIISTLEAGQIKIVDKLGEKHLFQIDGGVVEAKNDKIIILAENVAL